MHIEEYHTVMLVSFYGMLNPHDIGGTHTSRSSASKGHIISSRSSTFLLECINGLRDNLVGRQQRGRQHLVVASLEDTIALTSDTSGGIQDSDWTAYTLWME